MEKETIKQIAAIAWKGAANSFRMYPDSMHTFSNYWSGAENQFKEFMTDTNDEKIKQLVDNYCSKSQDAYEIATKEIFERFAKWMREEMKGGRNGN